MISHSESWAEHRRAMLSETSRFIEWGLAHPEEAIAIPAKPLGEGGWPKGVGGWFWSVVLTDSTDSAIHRWRHHLRCGLGVLLRRQ